MTRLVKPHTPRSKLRGLVWAKHPKRGKAPVCPKIEKKTVIFRTKKIRKVFFDIFHQEVLLKLFELPLTSNIL